MPAFASTRASALPRPALIPVLLHCRRCLTSEVFCPRCGAGLLVQGPASHVATNHLLRRDCIECGTPFGVVLDGYEADVVASAPCPSELVAQPPEPEELAMSSLTLPVVLTTEPAPANRRSIPLRAWWQLGHPAATSYGATVAAAYRAIYGKNPPKKQNCNVYLAAELDAVAEYMSSENGIEIIPKGSSRFCLLSPNCK